MYLSGGSQYYMRISWTYAMLYIQFIIYVESASSQILLNKYICNTRIWIMDHPGDKYTCLVTFRIISDILWDLGYDVL